MEAKKKNTMTVKYLNSVGNKTIRVEYQTKKIHPIYKKYIKTSKKYLVHFDSKDQLNTGDTLLIEFTRPISKNKSYKYIMIISNFKPTKKSIIFVI